MTSSGRLLGLALLGVGVSWVATKLLLLRSDRLPIDVPNERSSHRRPTPRGGGIGIIVAIAVGYAAMIAFRVASPPVEIMLAVLAMALTGLIDDWRHLPVLVRFGLQLAAAGMIVYRLGPIDRVPLPAPLDLRLGFLGIAGSIFWLVGVANVYNFLDGIDGYAGLQGFLAAAGVALLAPDAPTAAVGACCAGACLGFLLHNWHPAKVFMGDVGSLALGFLFAALPFAHSTAARPAVAYAMSLFLWFFLADGLFTLLRRLYRGQRIWTAHRSHLYQRLTIAGMSHSRVVSTVGIAAATIVSLTVLTMKSVDARWRWAPLMVAIAAFIGYLALTRRLERRAASAGVSQPLKDELS